MMNSKLKDILLYFAVFFLLQLVATAIVMGGGFIVSHEVSEKLSPFEMLLVEGIFALLVIVWFLWRRWTPVGRNWLQTRPYSVMAWSAIAALGTVVPSIWLQEYLTFLPDLASEGLMDLIMQKGGYFVIAILVPLSEEIVFRGAILRTLLGHAPSVGTSVGDASAGLAPWTAILLSALIFGLAHLNPAQLPHAFLLGLLLGWVYARTRSIVPGVIIHVVNNSATYLLARFYANTPDITLEQILGSGRQVALAVAFSLCILLPALFQLHQRMTTAK